MKKCLSILLLSGSLLLSGCGDSNTDFQQVSGQQGNPGPIVTPTPQPTAGYFVDATNGNDTTAAAAVNPTSDTPFATIQAAVADAPDGTTITVRAGSYSGAVTLKNGQRLLGVASGNRPVLTGNIVLGDGNTVDFLRVQNSAGDAIDGDSQNGGTITNNEVINATARGITTDFSTGTWTVTGNIVTDAGDIGIAIGADDTDQMRAQVNNNTVTGSTLGAISFLAEDGSQLVAQTHGNTMTGNQPGATFEAIAGTTATLSLDIEDNTNDDVYSFTRSATAFLNVEQFGQLIAINNNSGTVDVVAPTPAFLPPDDVADGFCGF